MDLKPGFTHPGGRYLRGSVDMGFVHTMEQGKAALDCFWLEYVVLEHQHVSELFMFGASYPHPRHTVTYRRAGFLITGYSLNAVEADSQISQPF